VPSSVWRDIALDFVEGFPKVGGKSVILTVVDRFSKYAHFIALGHPYSVTTVAKAFFNSIVCFHGVPASMVSDREPVFTSTLLEGAVPPHQHSTLHQLGFSPTDRRPI
jgi:hypothetical protein